MVGGGGSGYFCWLDNWVYFRGNLGFVVRRDLVFFRVLVDIVVGVVVWSR